MPFLKVQFNEKTLVQTESQPSRWDRVLDFIFLLMTLVSAVGLSFLWFRR